MKVFTDAWNRRDLPRGTVATIGNYDGVHRGQQAILGRVVDRARSLAAPAAVVTFDPHPSKVLWPDRAPRCLTTPEQKVQLLADVGIDVAFYVTFDALFARTRAGDFVDRFLHSRLDLREIYVGSQFVFGSNREGDLELLERSGRDAGNGAHPAFGVAEVSDSGGPISSTRIREAVATGHVAHATSMLGRPYQVAGTVVRGAGRGRELGWPTMNVEHENELLPSHGVYVVRVTLRDDESRGSAHPAVANVGVRPTLGESAPPLVECHLLDFDGVLYGRRVAVDFLERLRGEQAFPSLEALGSQIEVDVAAARAYFLSPAGIGFDAG